MPVPINRNLHNFSHQDKTDRQGKIFKRVFTNWETVCYDYSVRNASIGKKDCSPSFQRAAGWCKAVRSAVTLPLEQPAEKERKVGPDGVPTVIKGGHCQDAAEWVFPYQEEWYHGGFFTFVSCLSQGTKVFFCPRSKFVPNTAERN